ncbi:MAG TPA: SDR family oxidoreductase [Alphaproteobacteria bacterium]|nr:SDR family oxidoreductase [Alphaproteobacteria bacterium]
MIVAITGASAGVGRAVAREFARHAWDVALIARGCDRLSETAREIEQYGVRSLPISVDVADFSAVEAAAERIETELGPIDIWINNAMATVFAPVSNIKPDEFRRATEVTYLGQVHGTMVALTRMRTRDRGVIVNIGSALAYRAIPLQAAYCGAKFAVRGFTDALRCELLHDGTAVDLVMVHLPAVNTPQFDWALNKTGRKAQPVPPIFQPEVAARAIYFAATHPKRRELWVGLSSVKAILGNELAPGLLDRLLANTGYSGQLTDEESPRNAPANLFEPVPGDFGAHGRFEQKARSFSGQLTMARHPIAATAALIVGALALGVTFLGSRRRITHDDADGRRNQRTLRRA